MEIVSYVKKLDLLLKHPEIIVLYNINVLQLYVNSKYNK